MPEPVFIITNVAMHPETKVRRFYQPGRVRQKQFVAGRRLLHNQTLRLSPEEFEKHLDSIMERVKMGAFRVSTPDGAQIYTDQHGTIKERRGQEIRDCAWKPKTDSKPAPEDNIEELAQEAPATRVVINDVEIPPQDVKSVEVTQPIVTEEADFSRAYQAPEPQAEERKPEPGKKGKRR